jgi:putative ABC transport system permease protein
MLQLRNIVKAYKVGEFYQRALDGVTLSFGERGFVSILGESGSGKTTFLNIIGGLDRYDDGDLIINGKSTKQFKDADWDAYRNNSIGFVFQSYNLISHISVLANVEIAMTLSGISKRERKAKAMRILDLVGLKAHVYKKPTQLSGGQKQRVAIARAVTNDPDIIMMDEPTGALDTETSEEIMNLVKDVFQNKLVIMVTHNEQLARDYSDRIIRLQDGKVIDDTKPHEASNDPSLYQMKKTSMNFLTALRLSLSNLRTKFTRTLITSFAGSIGIIGIALVLALSNGFDSEIGNLERDTLSDLPISMDENVQTPFGPPAAVVTRGAEFSNQELIDLDFAIPFDPQAALQLHRNQITDEYITYLDEMDASWTSLLRYTYGVSLNFLNLRDDNVTIVNRGNLRLGFLPRDEVLANDFEVVAGRLPENDFEVILKVDEFNRFDSRVAIELDLGEEPLPLDDLLGTQLRLVPISEYFEKNEDTGFYSRTSDLQGAYDAAWQMTVVGVVRPVVAPDFPDNSVLLYSSQLPAIVIEEAQQSQLVADQLRSNFYLLGDPSSPLSVLDSPRGTTRINALRTVGAVSTPSRIEIYPSTFDNKVLILAYLDAWNEPAVAAPINASVGDTWEAGDGYLRTFDGEVWRVTSESSFQTLSDDDRILYQDFAQTITGFFSDLLSTISVVLVIFAAISLLVSSIMIGIITYVSVIERTKEIGILRAIGARKKDISRLFNAETIIIGVTAGSIGVLITFGLSFPINQLLIRFVDTVDFDLVILRVDHAVYLVIISTFLTLISGLIPSSIAAKKDPVEALRVE